MYHLTHSLGFWLPLVRCLNCQIVEKISWRTGMVSSYTLGGFIHILLCTIQDSTRLLARRMASGCDSITITSPTGNLFFRLAKP